jgi:hypothetical protein
MKLRQKAIELVSKFDDLLNPDSQTYNCTEAKQCAIIAVDELIKEQTMWQNGQLNPVLF